MLAEPSLRFTRATTDPIVALRDRPDAGRPASLTEEVKLLLTPPEAAEALAVSERTLWAMTYPRGPIPVVRLGRAVRYCKNSLEEFVRAAQVGGRS
jgi:excisionase family DNA binding protein